MKDVMKLITELRKLVAHSRVMATEHPEYILAAKAADALVVLCEQNRLMREALWDIKDSRAQYNYPTDELRLKASDAILSFDKLDTELEERLK